MIEPPSEAERRAFIEGYRYGTEAQIEAADPLLDLLTKLETLISLLAADFDAEDLECLPGIIGRRVGETMDEVRRLRLDDGEREAMELWQLERALPS